MVHSAITTVNMQIILLLLSTVIFAIFLFNKIQFSNVLSSPTAVSVFDTIQFLTTAYIYCKV